MPLVYQQNINLHTKLGVWHIAEDEVFFLKKVSLQSEIRHPHKRLQHLAGRYILKELYPDFPLELILVADTKKPFLPDEAFHFSISHCSDYAAAIVSSVNRVGTDIEIPQPKISSIRNKFLKETELKLLQNLPLDIEKALTLSWSIKEAVFKWYGEGKVDFRGHIHIHEISFENNQYTAECFFTKNEEITVHVQGLFFNTNCLTWIVS
jgi:phosphopantetheinyl transferase